MRPFVALSLLLVGCSAPPPPPPFELAVTALSDEGMTLPDLVVKVDDRVVGRTDQKGELKTLIPGSDEGRGLRVSVQTPPGYRAISDGKLVTVERMLRKSGGALPLLVEARFGPILRRYAVLVDVGRPDLSVEVFGVPKAVTNSAGVAMLFMPGNPGDTLDVRVAGNADLTPRYVAQTFTLTPDANVFTLAGEFASVVKKHHVARPHRPTPLLPRFPVADRRHS